jgi:hypothetical protein
VRIDREAGQLGCITTEEVEMILDRYFESMDLETRTLDL